MSKNTCPHCGAAIVPKADKCAFGGQPPSQGYDKHQQIPYRHQTENYSGNRQENSLSPSSFQNNTLPSSNSNTQNIVPSDIEINSAWPRRNKIVTALLAIFLGTFGIHKFYLGKIGMGFLYLLFTWTGIPAVLGVIEGIIYLISSDEKFSRKYKVRLD